MYHGKSPWNHHLGEHFKLFQDSKANPSHAVGTSIQQRHVMWPTRNGSWPSTYNFSSLPNAPWLQWWIFGSEKWLLENHWTLPVWLLFAGFFWISRPPVTWDPMILKVVLLWICKEGNHILTFLWARIPLACSDVSDKWMLAIQNLDFCGEFFGHKIWFLHQKKRYRFFSCHTYRSLNFQLASPKVAVEYLTHLKDFVNLSSIAHHGTMITSFFFEKFNFKSFKPFLGEYSTIVYHGNSRVPAHTPNTTTSTHLPGMDDATCHLEAVSLIVIHGDDMGPAPINGRKSMGNWCSGAPINGVHVLIFPRTIEADEHFNGAFWRGLFQHRSNEVTKGLRGAILRDQGERMCFS